jgi:hypothetical protein
MHMKRHIIIKEKYLYLLTFNKTSSHVLTLQVVCHFAHELSIEPDLYNGLAYGHWHADESHEEISN